MLKRSRSKNPWVTTTREVQLLWPAAFQEFHGGLFTEALRAVLPAKATDLQATFRPHSLHNHTNVTLLVHGPNQRVINVRVRILLDLVQAQKMRSRTMHPLPHPKPLNHSVNTTLHPTLMLVPDNYIVGAEESLAPSSLVIGVLLGAIGALLVRHMVVARWGYTIPARGVSKKSLHPAVDTDARRVANGTTTDVTDALDMAPSGVWMEWFCSLFKVHPSRNVGQWGSLWPKEDHVHPKMPRKNHGCSGTIRSDHIHARGHQIQIPASTHTFFFGAKCGMSQRGIIQNQIASLIYPFPRVRDGVTMLFLLLGGWPSGASPYRRGSASCRCASKVWKA